MTLGNKRELGGDLGHRNIQSTVRYKAPDRVKAGSRNSATSERRSGLGAVPAGGMIPDAVTRALTPSSGNNPNVLDHASGC